MKKLVALFASLFVISTFIVASPNSAEAADGSQFNPGLIISDSIFFAGDSMTASSIQTFLESKVPNCLSGYTCLKDYSQATPNMEARDGRCSAYAGSPGERASDIISKVGLACGISPKVLLVLLQKEQGLVLDDWPLSSQYQHATGFACPDTAPCDSSYAGFFNQVYSAAYQFKNYGLFNSSFNYHPGQINTILYNPDRDCGSSDIFIQNQATANLYIYTPYQPNDAALSNLYGTGDGCSAYGNRNFWRLFTDWFGATVEGHEYAITSLYQAAGGPSGALGSPATGFVSISAAGGGWVQGYQNGAITYKTNLGAFIISGLMRSQFNSKYGGIAGRLGWPVTSKNTITSAGGADVQGFENGALVISRNSTEAFILNGFLRLAFASAGSAAAIGWPTSDPTCQSESRCWQKFASANLYVNGASWLKVTNPILAKYTAVNGPLGALGWPAGNLVNSTASGGGIIQVFDSGVIVKSNTSNPVVLSGKIRTYFNTLGGLGGNIGWPVSDANCSSSSCTQTFQGATLICPVDGNCTNTSTPTATPTPTASNSPSPSPSTESNVAGPLAIDQEYSRQGGSTALGQPTSAYNSISTSGGGIVRGYERAAIAWSQNRGAFVLSGGIRTSFNALGSFSKIGWPVNSAICTSQGACSQEFSLATVTWSSSASGNIVEPLFSDAYRALGSASGVLGEATTKTISIDANGGGKVQAFAGGALARKNSSNGAFMLRGPIRAFYATVGGIGGTLGWPTQSEVCSSPNSCSQTFEGGVIDWDSVSGARLR